MTTKLGKPVFHYETDPAKGEKVEKEFWQKALSLLVKGKSEEKTA